MDELYFVRIFDFGLNSPTRQGIFDNLEELKKVQKELSDIGKDYEIIEKPLNQKTTHSICYSKLEINKLYY